MTCLALKDIVISVDAGSGQAEVVKGLAKAITYSVKRHNPGKVFFVVTEQSRSILLLVLENLRGKSYEEAQLHKREGVGESFRAGLSIYCLSGRTS